MDFHRIAVLALMFAAMAVARSSYRRKSTISTEPVRYRDNYYFDYADAPSSGMRYRAKANPTTTTERPLIRYWNNFVRSVRLPIPSITWNMSLPLANLFSPSQISPSSSSSSHSTVDYYGALLDRPPSSVSTKSKKRKRRTKKPQKKKTHKQEQLDENFQETFQQEQPNDIVQPSNLISYFYDPNTQQYYAVQQLRAFNINSENTSVYNRMAPNSISTHHQFDEEESTEDHKQQNTAASSSEADVLDATYLDDPASDVNLTIGDNKIAKTEPSITTDITSSHALSSNETEDADKVDSIGDEEDNKVELLHKDEEMLRNVLGTFMRDDHNTRQRQTVRERKPLTGHSRSNSKRPSAASKSKQKYVILLNFTQ